MSLSLLNLINSTAFSTEPLGGVILFNDPTQYPPTVTSNTTLTPGPNVNFTQQFSADNPYLDSVNNQNINNSPLKVNSLGVSQLDDVPLSEVGKNFNQNAEIPTTSQGRTTYPLGNFSGDMTSKPAETFSPSFDAENTYLKSGVLN
jgi:hypothetical protein